jgi:DNA polymerase-3 subunit alpha
MYLIFDLETTGLPEKKEPGKFASEYCDYRDNSKYDSARIVQIAWQLVDAKGAELSRHNYIICRKSPDLTKFDICNARFHGITNEIADKNGIQFVDAIRVFAKDLSKCDMIIAHNIQFDYNVLMNHLHRFGIFDILKQFEKKKQYCTMMQSVNVVKLPLSWTGRFYKTPSLAELYIFYFNEMFGGAHDAQHDVEACKKCFLKLNNL